MRITRIFKFCFIFLGFLMISVAFFWLCLSFFKPTEEQALAWLKSLKYVLFSIPLFIFALFFDELLELDKRIKQLEMTKKDGE